MNDTQPTWVHQGRVPFLDSLRALAISMVIVAHFGLSRGAWIGKALNGHVGVTLFFVISGFLITLLLLREFQKTGRISLKSFYYRRVLRIFPAYYTYLIVGFILAGLGVVYIGRIYGIAALTYMMCYLPALKSSWYVAHSWSLAVEEHYYVLWPLILKLFKPQRAWKIVLGYILITPAIRYALWSLQRDWLDVDYTSVTQMSSIGVGCLLAFMVRGEALPAVGRQLRDRPGWFFLTGVGLLFLSHLATRSGKYAIMAHDPVNAVACALIIAGLVGIRNRFVFGLLNNRLFALLGALSYSLYLWQQFFTTREMMDALTWPWRLAGLFAVALVSYYLIESPFLRLKDRAASGKDKS